MRSLATLTAISRTVLKGFTLLFLVVPISLSAQSANPYEGNRAAIRAGGALFGNECATCHNGDATGLNGPDLTQLFALGVSDSRIFRSIRQGVSGSSMPSTEAPDQEIWAMVAWLKSISTVDPFESSGDAEQGREIFNETCMGCHRVSGEGGSLGPDLTRIALVRSRDVLARAIRQPAASVARNYLTVTLVTGSGERVRGLRKGEDAFSIQVMDTNQRLQGYIKADLAELIYEDTSLMPAFNTNRLSDTQLDDLLGYLGSIQAANLP